MSDRNSPPPHAADASRRRSSISSQTFADLFGRSGNYGGGSSGPPGPITTAAQQAQRRRLSLTTVGLTGSSAQTSPFGGAFRPRSESISTAGTNSVDESPFEDGDAPNPPPSPFARRLSFGARALRDVKTGGNSNGNNEGFNFADNMRTRAERTSISGPSGGMPTGPREHHQRAKSVAVMEPPKEMPKAAARPDAFQERILKGDFYMD